MPASTSFTGRYLYRSDLGLLDIHNPSAGALQVMAQLRGGTTSGGGNDARATPVSMAFSANPMSVLTVMSSSNKAVQEGGSAARAEDDAQAHKTRLLAKGDHIAYGISAPLQQRRQPQSGQAAGGCETTDETLVCVGRRETMGPLWLARLPSAATTLGHSGKKRASTTPSRNSSGQSGHDSNVQGGVVPAIVALPNAYCVGIVTNHGRFLVACCSPSLVSSPTASNCCVWPIEDALPIPSLADNVVLAMTAHAHVRADATADEGLGCILVLLTATELIFVTLHTDATATTSTQEGPSAATAVCAAGATVVRCPLPLGSRQSAAQRGAGTPSIVSTTLLTVASLGGSDVYATRFDGTVAAAVQQISLTTSTTAASSSSPFAASCGLITGAFGTVGVVEAMPSDDGAQQQQQQRICFMTLITSPDVSGGATQTDGKEKTPAKKRTSGKAAGGTSEMLPLFEAVVLPPLTLPPSTRFVASSDLSATSSSTPTGERQRPRGATASTSDASSLVLVIEKQHHHLESVRIDLKLQGLPSQAAFDALPWTSCGPQSTSDDRDDEVVAPRSDATSSSCPSFAYLLPLSASKCLILRITAPFSTHSKLATQWVVGPKLLAEAFQQDNSRNSNPMWAQHRFHPAHIRAALRRLAAADLLAVFRAACACAQRGMLDGDAGDTDSVTAAALAMSNGCAMAMQVVTMHRQVGITLPKEDVSALFVVLRTCRAAGHFSGRAAQRLKSMLAYHESSLTHTRSRDVKSFGPTDPSWRGGRLHVRYCSSEFAEHVAAAITSSPPAAASPSSSEEASSVLSVVAGARLLLKNLNNNNLRGSPGNQSCGNAMHTDDVLHQYESAFLAHAVA